MKKREFEKEVKAMISRDGAKAVDINTNLEKVGLFKGSYIANVIAVRNHIAHRYVAIGRQDGSIECKYSACLG